MIIKAVKDNVFSRFAMDWMLLMMERSPWVLSVYVLWDMM